ncbi:MAG: CsbD family protein [Rhodothermales bacterium]
MTTPKEQSAEGSWKQMKGRLKEAWGALSDDDMDRFEGRRDQLVGMIEEKTGKSREGIRKKLDDIAKKVKYKF